ncbi:unnamed protein product, partial [Ixodes hexagonus]
MNIACTHFYLTEVSPLPNIQLVCRPTWWYSTVIKTNREHCSTALYTTVCCARDPNNFVSWPCNISDGSTSAWYATNILVLFRSLACCFCHTLWEQTICAALVCYALKSSK